MKELIIYIDSCYINAREENIRDCINSIEKNIGITDYSYYILVSNDNLESLYKTLIGNKIHKIKNIDNPKWWAHNFNDFVDECKGNFKNLMMTHDDVTIETNNFYNIYLEETKNTPPDNLGFTTFRNIGYNKINQLISNSARTGIAKDRSALSSYECHTNNINNLDWPKKTCVVWATFHMVNIISFKNILKISPLDAFGNWPVLADEDFSMEAMLKGMDNIWIPHIDFIHPLRVETRLKGADNPYRNASLPEKNFSKKWGISWGGRNYTDEDIQSLIERYKGTKFEKFYNKYSYEYIYLDEYIKNGNYESNK